MLSQHVAGLPAGDGERYFNGRRGAIPPEHGDLPVAVYTQTGRGDRRAVHDLEALLRFRLIAADCDVVTVAHSGMCC